ncbi:efflux RND transporter periplasmic adaptor subunit [Xylophilus rhododendri]|uniref:Efflux RND transporter periplasmic adaptor subunit n=1 Tax=Xylophilus rhododendri TaxID=2697032 RepID=A0A857J7Z2_9BURK|nr:efflux RND transporter periplasmic adaptor subunit [Xylophilus rhododendri]QHI99122.1 efflux RND transporter periplasmic adaptor subunit [Xylophilus rhododendri]
MSVSWKAPFPARSAVLSSIALAIVASIALSACGKKDAAPAAGGPPGGGMPPPQVGVVTVQPGNVGIETELPGRVEASRVAQVRARAAGILQKRLFTEGSDVKAGQVLYQIDPGPYAASAQSAAASLQRAEANLAQASATVQRYKPLVEVNAISKQDYVNAQATEKQAQADVAVGKAAVANAQITLGYAQVTAPISGRIGRSLVTEGALVGQGEATQLALIQQINPVYVNFTQSVAEVSRLRAAMQKGQLQRAGGAESAVVRIVQEDGSVLPQTGKLLFTDLSVDATTGQVTLRAEVPNAGGALLPGLYVRVRIEQAQVQNAVLLPQQAVTRTQQGDTVSIVAADGKISPRTVKINGSKDNNWVVTDGLKAGDQVMVDGFQKLQMAPPGTPVKAVPWTPAAPASAAPAAAAAPAAK